MRSQSETIEIRIHKARPYMSFRDVLQGYINKPEASEDVVYYDKHVVIVKDKFPKAIRHLLIIPRERAITHIHPLDVFNRNYSDQTGEELYESVLEYVDKAKDLIIGDLKHHLEEDDDLKLSTFKNDYIKAGIHSIPSLRNLHIHVITQDFHSSRLKNKKHFNSFATDFFVEFDKLDPVYNEKYQKIASKGDDYDPDSDYGSQSEDERIFIRHPRNEAILNDKVKSDLKCIHCGTNFDNKFVKLKEHLRSHFEERYGQFANYKESLLTPNNFITKDS